MRSSGQQGQDGRPGGASSGHQEEAAVVGRGAASSSIVEVKEHDPHFEPVLLGAAIDESPEAFSSTTSSSSGLPHANSAPPMVGNRQVAPPGSRTGLPRPYLASDVQDRQPRLSVFQRTFSERPEPLPLPTPLTGLARLFLNRKGGKSGLGQQGQQPRKQPPPPQQPTATWGITTTTTNNNNNNDGGWNSPPADALERAEKGVGGAGGGHDVASLAQLRARYISNAVLFGGDKGQGQSGGDDAGAFTTGGNGWAGQHDLERHKMDSIIDDPWIEDIRAQDFLMKLAMALQRYGSPPPRTEALLAALAPRLRVEGQFYLFPNLLLCSFGIDAASETHMLRCPQDFDAFRFRKTSHLVRLMLMDEAFDDPHDESGWAGHKEDDDPNRPRVRSLPQAVTKLDAIMNSPQLYPRAVQFVCQIAQAVGGTLVFWRGDVWDALIVAITTFFVAMLVFPGSDHFFISKVQVLASSIATGIVSTIGSTYLETPCMKALFYAPTAFSFPGWGLSLSVLEFSVGAPMLGTTRMMNAFVVALLIGYGIAIGNAAVMACLSTESREAMLPWASSEHCAPNPWWVQVVAFPFNSISGAILMHAAPVQWPVMVLSAGAVVALKNGVLAHINEQLAVFISALLIGLFGNTYGRITGSPALIVILNAVYMIVPGSMGVTAAAEYLDKDPTSQGATTAVSMFFIACSIAAGLLVSQGLAVAVATVGGWVCAHGTAAMREQHKERVRRRGKLPSSLGIDSVYF